jgi:hypothetical protein
VEAHALNIVKGEKFSEMAPFVFLSAFATEELNFSV